ncbi:hypothetical protein [Sphingobium sp. LB126]|nr:hypothetical protein [Sphingobium sp. LB126]
MTDDNRESWLNRVALGMAPLFDALGVRPRKGAECDIGILARY